MVWTTHTYFIIQTLTCKSMTGFVNTEVLQLQFKPSAAFCVFYFCFLWISLNTDTLCCTGHIICFLGKKNSHICITVDWKTLFSPENTPMPAPAHEEVYYRVPLINSSWGSKEIVNKSWIVLVTVIMTTTNTIIIENQTHALFISSQASSWLARGSWLLLILLLLKIRLTRCSSPAKHPAD